MPSTRTRRAALGMLCGLGLAACSAQPGGPTVRQGGTLHMALPAAPQSLNPLAANDIISARAYTPLFPLLYAAQADLSVGPDLAAALPSYSDGGKTVTVPLRGDAHWSDGKPIGADDVVYTVSTETSPQLQTRAHFDWGPLTGVKKVDDHTVRFTLSRADAAFLANQLVTPIVPQHVLAGVDPARMLTAAFSKAPTVSGGPFVYSHRDAAGSIFLDANTGYFRNRPHADHLVEHINTDETKVPDALGTGSLSWDLGLSPTAAAQAVISSGVSVSSFADPSLVAVQFNTRGGRPFAATESRQAFATSVDHDLVVGQATGASQGFPVWGDLQPASWAGNTAAKQYTRNPSAAAQLLHGAHPAGTILYPQSDRQRATAAAILAQQTREAGFNLVPSGVGDDAFAAALASGNFDVAVVSVFRGLDPDDLALVGSGGAQNAGGYSNPALDGLIASELNATAAPSGNLAQQRKPVFVNIEQIVSTDLPIYPLWAPRHYAGFSATLGGVSAVGVHLDADRNSTFLLDWFLTA